jgi:hypothetical protein
VGPTWHISQGALTCRHQCHLDVDT